MTKERAKKFLFGGIILIIVLGAVVWFGRPAYRRYKETRSLSQARAFLQKGDFRNAVLSLRQTLAVNSTNVEAAGLMANLLAEAHSPTALAWRQQVAQLSPTVENKLLLAATALQFERPPFPIAAQVVDELQGATATNTGYHLIASQLALRLGRLNDAETHLQAAARLEPTNRVHQLNLALLHLYSTNTVKTAEARNQLSSLISDPALGEYALRSLVADSLLTRRFAQAKQFSDQLLASPKARFEDRLQHLTVLNELGSEDTTNWLARIQSDASTNIVRIAQTAEWLNAHKRQRQSLDWLSSLPPSIRSAVPLPFLMTESYAALNDWVGLEAWLLKERWKEQEFLRFAWLARAYREQNRNEMAEIHWRRAVSAAERRIEFQAALNQMAASWNWNRESEALLWTIVKRDPKQDWAWQSLLRISARDASAQHRIYSAILENNTNSLVIKNNLAMLSLLLNRDVTRTVQWAREVYEANTNNAHFVSTYAFALHTQNKSEEGLKLMMTLPESDLMRPEIAIYYAVLLSATGQREKAAPYFAAAEKAPLLPEEQQLLAKFRAEK